jgi:hypothetical protein
VQYLMWAEGIFDFDFSLLNSGTACMGSFWYDPIPQVSFVQKHISWCVSLVCLKVTPGSSATTDAWIFLNLLLGI